MLSSGSARTDGARKSRTETTIEAVRTILLRFSLVCRVWGGAGVVGGEGWERKRAEEQAG
jgi:hypothetical protein